MRKWLVESRRTAQSRGEMANRRVQSKMSGLVGHCTVHSPVLETNDINIAVERARFSILLGGSVGAG